MTKEVRIAKTTLILVLAVLILLSLFLVRPAVTGFGVYQQIQKTPYDLEEYGQNVVQLEQELSTTKENLEVHTTLNEKVATQIQDLSSELTACLVENGKSQAKAVVCDEKLVFLEEQIQYQENRCNEMLAEKEVVVERVVEENKEEAEQENELCLESLQESQDELSLLEDEYNTFVANLARSVCCKERVDNPAISSYDVIAGSLVCLEEGEKELSC